MQGQYVSRIRHIGLRVKHDYYSVEIPTGKPRILSGNTDKDDTRWESVFTGTREECGRFNKQMHDMMDARLGLQSNGRSN